MKKILETERLLLREFNLADTDFIIELLNSPGWLQYIGDRQIRTTEDASTYLMNGPLKSYNDNGFGLCMVALKTSGEGIGMCGIIRRTNLERPDIGFAFLPAYIGHGYGFEIASATLAYAQRTLRLPEIWAITVPYNVSSIKLIEKIGLKFKKNISLDGGGEELMLYGTMNQHSKIRIEQADVQNKNT